MKFECCVDGSQLPLVLQSGFDFAELRVGTVLPDVTHDEWAPIRDEILGHRVPILGFNVLLPGHLRVVGPEVNRTALLDYVDIAFARMSELGGKYLSFGSGGARRIPDGFNRNAAEGQLREFVYLLGEKGLKYGITVNVEFLNKKETNVILSLLEAKQYVLAANVPSVKLLADLYHMMEEAEPLHDLREVSNHLGYVHVADSGRRHPGSGQYPYIEFARVLQEIGYDGPVSVECTWGENLARELKESSAYLRSVFH